MWSLFNIYKKYLYFILFYFTFIAINKKIFKSLVNNISYGIALGFKFLTFV